MNLKRFILFTCLHGALTLLSWAYLSRYCESQAGNFGLVAVLDNLNLLLHLPTYFT